MDFIILHKYFHKNQMILNPPDTKYIYRTILNLICLYKVISFLQLNPASNQATV